MVTRTQLRERIDKAYPWLATLPLYSAIGEVRRLRRVDREYYRAINRSHDREDAEYEHWRDQQ